MIKTKYDSIDDVPDKFSELFEEQEDGSAVLVGIDGIKTQADVDKAMESLRKERQEHKATKARFKDALGADDAQALRDEIEDLKGQLDVVGDGKFDERKVQELAEKRAEKIAAQKTREIERELKAIREELSTATSELETFRGADKRRKIIDQAFAVTKGDKGIKLRDTAMDDWEMLAERIFDLDESGNVITRDGAPGGFEAGLSPRDVLEAMQKSGSRKHWFPESRGTGAREGGGGGGGVNPFAGNEPNLTEISSLVKNDPARAKRLAAAAERTDLLPPEMRG